MRVLLRADAGHTQGTGHVMRCLTLGEELSARGHEVVLATADLPEGWLRLAVADSGFRVVEAARDVYTSAAQDELDADWTIVDSYRIPADEISSARGRVLAVVDGDDRGIVSTLYLDQNLGARVPPARADRTLAGSDYALVRAAVLRQRRNEPWRLLGERAHIVSFMGGTDPTGASIPVARALAHADASLTIVAPPDLHPAILEALGGRADAELLSPTPDLPALFGRADIVVTAAGTSAWDVCALAIPAILVGVVDNQSESLAEAASRGVALGIDAVGSRSGLESSVASLVTKLLTDPQARRELSEACSSAFDGRGAARVAERLEQEVTRQ